MKIQGSLLLALAFALMIAIFAVINVEPVRVNYLFGASDLPLILVILGSTLLGGLIVGLFGILRQYRLQRRIRQLEAQLKPAESAETVAGAPGGALAAADGASSLSPLPVSAAEGADTGDEAAEPRTGKNSRGEA